MSAATVRLWSDEPAPVDLLAFGAVAETAVEAVLDDTLDPIALGVSGPWGSGKSTVLQLIEIELKRRFPTQEGGDPPILLVQSDPWRYDPAVGAKATLISEVLTTIQAELERQGGVSKDAQNLVVRLAKRVNWVKALNVAAKASLALQLPSIDDLTSLIKDKPEGSDEEESKTLDEFRDEFETLLRDKALAHVQRVVVLVDDLDRCLPPTVVETLETMRLFLAVPKMSFVIAADEERVADAVRSRYPGKSDPNAEEEPAKLYLHKIVQTTLRLPALSRFDTEAYLLLLQLQKRKPGEVDAVFDEILRGCTELRISAGTLEDLKPPSGVDISEERTFASRMTPILYEKLHGSPRRIKRFLNDLNVRASIASRRGIELDPPLAAKLMILELLLPDEFAKVLDWLARGELRERLAELERQAGRAQPEAAAEPDSELKPEASEPSGQAPENASDHVGAAQAAASEADTFSESFLRWAMLPGEVGKIDLSPYLHLAASFAGRPLIDVGLPERLRDIAAGLLSSSRLEQKAVSDADIRGLKEPDAAILVEHLGRMGRDRPGEMIRAVAGVLRVAGLLPAITAQAERALRALPLGDIRPPVLLLFQGAPATQFAPLLSEWSGRAPDGPVKNTLAQVLGQGTR